MNILGKYTVFLFLALLAKTLCAQQDYKQEIEELKLQKEQITLQEKDALKQEVEDINKRLDHGELSPEEAKILKENAAKKRALNIENRLAIVDNKIALLERNEGKVLKENSSGKTERIGLSVMVNDEPWTPFDRKGPVKYDRRTYSDFVMAIGLNNAIIEGQSLDDSPYKIGGSRFFEIGWSWRTRVFRNTNFMRFHYGFSFQFNGLKPEGNQIFVENNGQTELQEFEFDLDKSKFRMDNLVFPVHLEFGPSRFRQFDDRVRYSLHRQFRLGIGGYGGFNLGTRQKLKYSREGNSIKDKMKRDYNTSGLIYGLSAYIGIEGVLLYAKYDLNPIFKDAEIEQHNVSLGLRFDL